MLTTKEIAVATPLLLEFREGVRWSLASSTADRWLVSQAFHSEAELLAWQAPFVEAHEAEKLAQAEKAAQETEGAA